MCGDTENVMYWKRFRKFIRRLAQLGTDEDKDEGVEQPSKRGLLGRARGVVGSATEGVKRSADVMSGADIRRFDDFTDAATTVIVGVHRDQLALRERIDRAEQSVADSLRAREYLANRLAQVERRARSRDHMLRWLVAVAAMAIAALLLSVAAMVLGMS